MVECAEQPTRRLPQRQPMRSRLAAWILNGRIHHYRDAGAWPAEQALTAMLDNQLNAFAAVRLALPSIAIAATGAAERLRERGRLIYCGAGASGRLAIQDGVELHPTFGWPVDRLVYLIAGGRPALTSSVEGAEDDAECGRS